MVSSLLQYLSIVCTEAILANLTNTASKWFFLHNVLTGFFPSYINSQQESHYSSHTSFPPFSQSQTLNHLLLFSTFDVFPSLSTWKEASSSLFDLLPAIPTLDYSSPPPFVRQCRFAAKILGPNRDWQISSDWNLYNEDTYESRYPFDLLIYDQIMYRFFYSLYNTVLFTIYFYYFSVKFSQQCLAKISKIWKYPDITFSQYYHENGNCDILLGPSICAQIIFTIISSNFLLLEFIHGDCFPKYTMVSLSMVAELMGSVQKHPLYTLLSI